MSIETRRDEGLDRKRQSEGVLLNKHSNNEREGLKAMETLQQKIAGKFIATRRESKSLDETKLEQLEKLLNASKKPRSDDFVKIFAAPAGGDVK
jgi:hypothetical protein